MEIFFADDSGQRGHRGGMGRLIAMGGCLMPETCLRPLKDGIDALCAEFGLPPETELKWSPGRNNWLRDNLKAERRCELIARAVRASRELGGRAIVVVWDTGRTTLQGTDALRRTINYLFERVTMHLEDSKQLGIVICDRPGGGRQEEDALIEDVVDTMEKGTPYVASTQVALNLLTASSHLSRHLQVADLIVGCTTAMVAGETQFAIPVFAEVRPMLIKNALNFAGGTGLKLFPNSLINLYFYVLGETAYATVATNSGISLPWRGLPYYYDGIDQSKRTDARGDR